MVSQAAPFISGFLLGLVLVVCGALLGGAIVYFVIRDLIRFGRRGIPASWAVGIIVFFTALGFWAARFWGLLVAPVLGAAFALGRRQAQKEAAAGENHDLKPKA